jgi:hypothetical protein
VVGAAGPIGHPGQALVAVALSPPLGSGPAELEPFGSSGHRPALLDDHPGQPEPAKLAQGSVRWSTRTSWVGMGAWQLHTRPGGPRAQQVDSGQLDLHQPPWAVHLALAGLHRQPEAASCPHPAPAAPSPVLFGRWPAAVDAYQPVAQRCRRSPRVGPKDRSWWRCRRSVRCCEGGASWFVPVSW